MAHKLVGAFEERSRRPDLAIIMYCRPDGASNAEVHSATGDVWAQKAKKLHLRSKLDFMKAEMPGGVRYFVGPPDSRPGPANAVEYAPRGLTPSNSGGATWPDRDEPTDRRTIWRARQLVCHRHHEHR
jgi:hypothetical protein